MLYMVECGFSDPAREEEWSAWYSGPKIARTLTVPGFLRSRPDHAAVATAGLTFSIHDGGRYG